MTFLIITHLAHKRNSCGQIGGYGPYIREINIWTKHVEKVVVIAPLEEGEFLQIDLHYADQSKIQFIRIPKINFTQPLKILTSTILLPIILFKIIRTMSRVDHVHLRCPGNIGLLGCIGQIFFPGKQKSAKYAGNWSSYPNQPISYKLQKVILRNTIITRNMKALVYGEWPNQTSNVVSFFTASYSEKEIEKTKPRDLSGTINLVFVGTLTENKNPLLSVRVAEELNRLGINVHLSLLGDGVERPSIEKYIADNNLGEIISLKGNVSGIAVKKTLQESHFLIFLSESEGWPKAVAESMFWGCIPVTKPISCVPWMLGGGERGILLNKNAEISELAIYIMNLIRVRQEDYHRMSLNAANWSRRYTLERFEESLKMLL